MNKYIKPSDYSFIKKMGGTEKVAAQSSCPACRAGVPTTMHGCIPNEGVSYTVSVIDAPNDGKEVIVYSTSNDPTNSKQLECGRRIVSQEEWKVPYSLNRLSHEIVAKFQNNLAMQMKYHQQASNKTKIDNTKNALTKQVQELASKKIDVELALMKQEIGVNVGLTPWEKDIKQREAEVLEAELRNLSSAKHLRAELQDKKMSYKLTLQKEAANIAMSNSKNWANDALGAVGGGLFGPLGSIGGAISSGAGLQTATAISKMQDVASTQLLEQYQQIVNVNSKKSNPILVSNAFTQSKNKDIDFGTPDGQRYIMRIGMLSDANVTIHGLKVGTSIQYSLLCAKCKVKCDIDYTAVSIYDLTSDTTLEFLRGHKHGAKAKPVGRLFRDA